MRTLFVALLVLLFPVSAIAAPFLASDYYDPTVQITACEIEVNGTVMQAGTQVNTSGTRIHHDLASWQGGTYSVRARCSNDWGASNWTAVFTFTKAVPTSPTNLSIKSQ